MAMTNAEKQRRYRARLREGARPVHYRRAQDRRSHAQRWREAVASWVQLQEHYGEWQEKLPESLQASALGEKLQAIAELDLEELLLNSCLFCRKSGLLSRIKLPSKVMEARIM